ncbi:MAG: heavy-metal-associated domain-containing protein [Anaerolineae bacterium]
MATKERWHVPAISCGHCAMRIRKALANVRGVTAVSVDVNSKTVRLTLLDEAAAERARQAMEAAGYPPDAA